DLASRDLSLTVNRCRLALGLTLKDGIRDLAGQQPDRADRVVVGRDRVVDLAATRLGDGDLLAVWIDHEDRLRRAMLLLHAAEQALQSLKLVEQLDAF